MRNFVIILLIVFCLGMMFSFMFLSIDIVDGRNMGLKTSPYIGADTTNGALLLSLVFMLMALLCALVFAYVYRENQKIDQYNN